MVARSLPKVSTSVSDQNDQGSVDGGYQSHVPPLTNCPSERAPVILLEITTKFIQGQPSHYECRVVIEEQDGGPMSINSIPRGYIVLGTPLENGGLDICLDLATFSFPLSNLVALLPHFEWRHHNETLKWNLQGGF
jgi:hypothetical protein